MSLLDGGTTHFLFLVFFAGAVQEPPEAGEDYAADEALDEGMAQVVLVNHQRDDYVCHREDGEDHQIVGPFSFLREFHAAIVLIDSHYNNAGEAIILHSNVKKASTRVVDAFYRD